MKNVKIKGSFSDLKPSLESLKNLMEEAERIEPEKPDKYQLQEDQLKWIKEKGSEF